MAMSVTYMTVHGRLREETRGGVTTRYLGDTLGSVIKTTDTSGNVTSTTTYWPFGEVRMQTGTNPSPWGFCGVWGYLTDAVSRMYVRARHYRADTSRWLTVDLLWPAEAAFKYVDSSPVQFADASGTQVSDSVSGWTNQLFPPGSGLPNWILPDHHRARCIDHWNPITWVYGKCCGFFNRCHSKSPTVNCLDAACAIHDACLATAKEFVNPWLQWECNSKFCNDIHYCYSQHCVKHPIDRKQCQAMYEAGTFYCTSVGMPGPPSWS